MSAAKQNGRGHPQTLRLMIVEDTPADAELILAVLQRAGYRLTYDVVDSAALFQQKLAESTYDLVLSDHNLVTWTGMDALQSLRSTGKGVPFVLVSAVLGDEAAVEYIKQGAADYILKHRLDRLPAVVGRALQEKAHREEEARLQNVIASAKKEWELTFDAVPDLVMLLDTECRIQRANRAVERFANRDFPEIIGKSCYEVLLGANLPPPDCPCGRVLQTGEEEQSEFCDPRSERTFETTVSPILERTGAVGGCVCVTRDISERKRAEQALRQSEERYRELLENAHDAIYTMDPAGNFTSFNKMAERISGYSREEALQMNLDQILAPESLEPVCQAMQRVLGGGEPVITEMEIIARDGHRVALEANGRLVLRDGKPAAIQAIARDVSERKQLEAQFIQAQKMEAVGRLAGGVAHDFNNLLGVIIGYAELLLEHLDPPSPQSKQIEQIKKAAERGVSLTRQLLSFSRKQVLQPRVLDLNTVVDDCEKLIRRLVGENIEVVPVLGEDLGRVKADPGQLEQVIMNLAINAKDAMPNGGTLTIATLNVALDEHEARSHGGIQAGAYVMLAITDTGVGMSKEVQAHIFEPFFTTKAPGKGTGLGLSTAYGIARQSNGHIWVYSEVGKGTIFRLYLPVVEEPLTRVHECEQEPVPAGFATVLLVEDEDSLRAVARKFLVEGGYKVYEASNGLEALEIVQHGSEPVDLLLTDVIMPGMNGWQLAKRLERLHPDLKIIYMSGYTDDSIVNHGVLEQGAFFIEKPFPRQELLRKVHEVLAQRKARAGRGSRD